MGLNQSGLWLNAFKTAEAAELLGELWPREIAGDNANPQRQVLAVSAPGNRTLVLDSSRAIRLEFAAKLCEGLEVEGLWYELVETSLHWRACRLGGGLVTEDISRPERRRDGGFPAFGDAGEDLFEFLGAEAIPAAFRLVSIRDFERAEGRPNAAILTRSAPRVPVHGTLLKVGLRDLQGPSNAPIEFSAAEPDKRLGMDMFVLEGLPDPAGLHRILKAFSRIARRKQVGGWRWKPQTKFIVPGTAAAEAARESKRVEAELKEEFVKTGGTAAYGFEL